MSENGSAISFAFGEKIFAGNIDQLNDLLEPALINEHSSRFIVDLQRVRLCDSSGLRLLLNFQRRAAAVGKTLILYRPDNILQDMLKVTRLYQVFTIVDQLHQDTLPDAGADTSPTPTA